MANAHCSGRINRTGEGHRSTSRWGLAWCLALGTTGCLDPSGVIGNGRVLTEQRSPGEFRCLDVQGPFAVSATLASGTATDPVYLGVRADDNLLPLVETVVQQDTLAVRIKKGQSIAFSRALEVVFTTRALECVSLGQGAFASVEVSAVNRLPVSARGSSRLTVRDANATTLEVKADDHGDVTIRGSAANAEVWASASSWVDLKGLPLDSAVVELSGGSRLDAEVVTAVSGSVSGGSQLNVKGAPANSVAVSGGSTVKFQ